MTSVAQLEHYLEEHLTKELAWLLRAATEWHAQHCMNLGIDGYSMQVYALDSTVLHAWTLFEFFTQNTSVGQNANYYNCTVYKVPLIGSILYQFHWRRPIHSHMMHAQDRRPVTQLPTYDDHAQTKPLNEMPVDFAKEIVRLWRVFVKDLNNHTNLQFRPIGATAQTALASEINAAKRVRTNDVTQRQIAVGKETSRLEPNFSIPQIEWPA